MNFFSKKTVNSTDLKTKSVKALDSFHQVMNDLKQIINLSSAKQTELKEESLKIQTEISELEAINIANSKVITNIEKILN